MVSIILWVNYLPEKKKIDIYGTATTTIRATYQLYKYQPSAPLPQPSILINHNYQVWSKVDQIWSSSALLNNVWKKKKHARFTDQHPESIATIITASTSLNLFFCECSIDMPLTPSQMTLSVTPEWLPVMCSSSLSLSKVFVIQNLKRWDATSDHNRSTIRSRNT